MFPELRSDRAVGPLVPSVVAGTNADLIDRIKGLYLTGSVLDTTYGKGGWWTRYRPDRLVVPPEGTDFRDLPYEDRSFDTVCFDPPYIDTGGTETSTVAGFQQAYGVDTGRDTSSVFHLMTGGLEECARVASRWVLVKCMDYVSGGRFRPVSYNLVAFALSNDLRLHDEIVHHAGPGPGGHNVVDQIRARRHHSKLLVFTKSR